MAANLSPRLSEVDVVEAIRGHLAPYIQRTLLSANIPTIRQALIFLNMLDSMEDSESHGSHPDFV
jgi:hypothetical protein